MKLLQRFRPVPKTPERRKELRRDWALLTLAGVLMAVAFPPYGWSFLLFIAFIPFLAVITRRNGLAEINRAFYLTAFVFSLLTIHWVSAWSMLRDTYLLAAGGALLLGNPIIFLIAGTAYYFTSSRFGHTAAVFLLPFFWVSYEYGYMVTDWCFPWLTLGNGMTGLPLYIQLADIIGSHGLTILVVFTNVCLFSAWQAYRRSSAKAAAFLVVAVLLVALPVWYGATARAAVVSNGTLRVGLIQPNLDPYDKWSGGNLAGLASMYLSFSRQAAGEGAQVVFWPETALPVYLTSGLYDTILDSLHRFADTYGVTIITGMPDMNFFFQGAQHPPDAKYSRAGDYYYTTYNAVLQIDPGNTSLRKYGKMALVPFGEHAPFVERIPALGDLLRWGVGLGGWNTGKDTSVFPVRLRNTTVPFHVGALVCFESVFPAIPATMTKKGAALLAVVTNDSWYGNSPGPYQHKEYAVLRAVENRRPVVRAANGGISCVIDARGNTLRQTAMYTQAVLTADVPIAGQQLTFFSSYPLLVPVLSAIITLLASAAGMAAAWAKRFKPLTA